MNLEIGDVVYIIGATDEKGCSCVAVGTVTEIGQEKVTLEKIVTFSPKGFRIHSNSLEGFDPNKHNEYPENKLSRVSPVEPLYAIDNRTSL